jgi:hypothetical protein
MSGMQVHSIAPTIAAAVLPITLLCVCRSRRVRLPSFDSEAEERAGEGMAGKTQAGAYAFSTIPPSTYPYSNGRYNAPFDWLAGDRIRHRGR